MPAHHRVRLNENERAPPLAKLEAAIQQFDGGKLDVVVNLLVAFQNEVTAQVKKGMTLSVQQGQELFDAAAALIAALSG